MDDKTKTVQRKYNRFSYIYDFLETFIEKRIFRSWRNQLLHELKGNILEIGVGTGKNLQYYNKDAHVTGIDLSPKMLQKAKEKAKKLGSGFVLRQMDAQQLDLEDNRFDYVLCTFVLCSIPDPIKALKEMNRVCKPRGQLLMLEHVKSKHKIIAFFQHLHNPFTRFLFGFNVNRPTPDNIKKAGLQIKKEINLKFFDVFKRIEIKKET